MVGKPRANRLLPREEVPAVSELLRQHGAKPQLELVKTFVKNLPEIKQSDWRSRLITLVLDHEVEPNESVIDRFMKRWKKHQL